MTKEEDKWEFCPFKECYYCYRNLENVEKKTKEAITRCHFCHRSFTN